MGRKPAPAAVLYIHDYVHTRLPLCLIQVDAYSILELSWIVQLLNLKILIKRYGFISVVPHYSARFFTAWFYCIIIASTQ
jgi:hypothetical protein